MCTVDDFIAGLYIGAYLEEYISFTEKLFVKKIIELKDFSLNHEKIIIIMNKCLYYVYHGNHSINVMYI